MERIKNTIYKMVMECLETSLPLSIKVDPETYVELTNIIIPDIVCDTPKPGGPLTTRQPAEY